VLHDRNFDCRPAALVLFSPLLNTAPGGHSTDRFPDPKTAKRQSPTKLIRKKLPPSILFQGTADRILSVADARKFARKMQRKGNLCEFVDFEGADHSFFNFNVSQTHFELTIEAADRFLTDLGLLPDKPADPDLATD
jgi:acetyl esterase/lipase